MKKTIKAWAIPDWRQNGRLHSLHLSLRDALAEQFLRGDKLISGVFTYTLPNKRKLTTKRNGRTKPTH